jgi:flagella basal body P-ring formation protein FlgA
MSIAKQLLSGLMVAAIVSPTASVAQTQITLRDRVAMKSSVVRLSDIAEITTSDEQLTEKYAAMPLMPAPGAGGQRFLRKREIEDLLAAHGADLSDVRIQGPAQVVISSVGTEQGSGRPTNRHAEILAGRNVAPVVAEKLDPSEAESLRTDVRHLVAAYLSSKSPDAAGCEITCDVAERHLTLLQIANSSPVCSGGNPPWTGRQRLVVKFTTDKGEVGVPVYAEVTPKAAPAVVAIESIPRGAVITAAHLELRMVDRLPKSNQRRLPVDSVEKLIGMEAKQTIQAGAIVFSDHVQAPILVKRGELITVASESGAIRVRTTVRAMQDRSKGQLVQVESLDTKERFDARVTGLRIAAIMTVASPSVGNQSSTIETARR